MSEWEVGDRVQVRLDNGTLMTPVFTLVQTWPDAEGTGSAARWHMTFVNVHGGNDECWMHEHGNQWWGHEFERYDPALVNQLF